MKLVELIDVIDSKQLIAQNVVLILKNIDLSMKMLV